MALFTARARAVRRDFDLRANTRAVAEICVALDGLLLALELAAARVNVLSAAALRDRLERRLPLLVAGPRDVPVRQQTLRAAIDWSYDLLGEGERELFSRLAVFAGGCSATAAGDVCGATLAALGSLVEKSLIQQRPGSDGDVRFGMLETMREYASERLREREDAELRRRAHAEHFLALAEEAEPELKGEGAAAWLARLEDEHDNFRAALGWARRAGATELELRLASALDVFLELRGHLTEGRGWLEGALSRRGEAPAPVRAKALKAAAILVLRQGDHRLARGLLEEALALYRDLGDERWVARMLANLGSVAIHEGDYERATGLFEETIPLFRAAGDDRALAVTLSNLASIAKVGGDDARARELGEEGLAVALRGGDKEAASISLHNLARAALRERRHDDAARRFADSLELGVELGYKELIAYCVEGFGELAAARREWRRAARLLGAGKSMFDALGVPVGSEEREGYEATLERLEEPLGDAALAKGAAEGRAMSPEQAVSYALESTGPA